MQTHPISQRIARLAPVLLICALCYSTFAATNTTPGVASGSEHRCLIILDTSRGMKNRVPASMSAIGDVIYGGLGGQLQNGDTVGVWTLNDKLSAGNFPLITWSTNRARAQHHTSRIVEFLSKQQYANKADFSQLAPILMPILKDSRLMTVIYVTDGLTPVQGTEFDQQINDACKKWVVEQQRAKKPIFVILRSHAGKQIHFSVTPVPWPIELPDLPVEPKPVVAEIKTNKPVMLPPLIVTGKKPALVEPAAQPTNTAISTTATNRVVPPAVPLPAVAPATTPAAVIATPATNTALAPAKPALPPVTKPTVLPAASTNTPARAVVEPAAKPAVKPAEKPSTNTPAPATGVPAPPAKKASAQKASNTPPAELATAPVPGPAAPGAGGSKRFIIFGAAGVLVVSVLAFALYLMLRPRPAQHVSLITRSLDRDQPKKP